MSLKAEEIQKLSAAALGTAQSQCLQLNNKSYIIDGSNNLLSAALKYSGFTDAYSTPFPSRSLFL